jgi:hypothetical protein
MVAITKTATAPNSTRRTPLPAAVVCRGIGGLLCRDRQRRAKAGLRLFRGRAGPTLSGQAAQQRRGAADRGEYRQAAGAIAQALRVVDKVWDEGDG